MKNIFRYHTFLFILWLLFAGLAAQALPSRPSPPRLVNDFEKLLTPSEINALENKLADYARSHSTQIVVIITNELYGLEISDFSTRLGSEWGVGTAGSENGVIVTVSPQQKKTFIATGYGLEGVIPDITAKRIVENEILPEFRNGNYYQGLDQATNVLMQLAAGEFAAS
jgi:uncharacterized protein